MTDFVSPGPLRQEPRPLAVALAEVADTLPLADQTRWHRINRIVARMKPEARALFDAELIVRRAMRAAENAINSAI